MKSKRRKFCKNGFDSGLSCKAKAGLKSVSFVQCVAYLHCFNGKKINFSDEQSTGLNSIMKIMYKVVSVLHLPTGMKYV